MTPTTYDLPLHCLSVGDTILIYWDGDRKWYPAEITAAAGDHGCEVLYRDGEREWLSLDNIMFIVERDVDCSVHRRSKRAKNGNGGEEEEAENGIEMGKTIFFDLEKGNGEYFEDNHFQEKSKGWNRVDDQRSNELLDSSGQCVDVAVPSSTPHKCLNLSVSSMFPSMVGELPVQDRTVLLTSDSDCEFEVKVIHRNGSSPLHKSKPDNKNVTLSSTKGKIADGLGRKTDSSFLTPKKGKVGTVTLRRSNRLKKSTFEDAKVLLESHFLTMPILRCSTEAENHDDSVSARASLDKVARIKHDRRSHGSSEFVSAPRLKKKRNCISGEVEYSDGITDCKVGPSDERSSGDSMRTCDYRLTDGLQCSICQIGVASSFLVQCKQSGCFCAFHTFCLNPPLQMISEDWICPYCDGDASTHKLSKQPVLGREKRVQSIVGHKRVNLEHQRNDFQYQFLIKWESLSHFHDSWVPLEWLYHVYRARLHSYQKKFPEQSHGSGGQDNIPPENKPGVIYGRSRDILDIEGSVPYGADSIDQRKSEWFKIDRVIACRGKVNLDNLCEIWKVCKAKLENVEFEFLVKWTGLNYCEATWESSFTEELLAEVGKLVLRHERAAERAENCSTVCGVSELEKMTDNLYGGILYDYQLKGIHWILNNFEAKRSIILADEMGLGKTVQVVCFVRCMKQARLNANPVLIIAPKSILFQWEKEFCRWAKELNVIIYQGEKKSRLCIQAHEMYSSGKRVLFDALITNYELVRLDCSVLKKFKWSAIIIDEAHKIKHLDCKLASCLKRYISDFRLLLTGTPLQNTLLELFALLHFIDPEHFSNPKDEAEAFSSIKSGRRHSEVEMKIAQIHELLRPRMLRRMKSDVLSGSMPVKKWVEVPCVLTDSQRELYIDILEKNYKKLNKGIESGKKIILNFILMELKKCCNHPYLFPGQEICHSSNEAAFLSLVAASGKLQLLEKLLPKLKERGNRVLLFSQMTKMLDILEDFLVFLGLVYFRIDGRTSIAARQQQMKEFNNPECDVFIFLISTRAGGLGIDLPTADRVIIYDPDFNPFMDLQAQSRAHRIGQTRPVVVYQLITKCSVEEKILQKSKEKLAIENLVMNPSKKPAADELHSILLHGARTILNRKKVHATSVDYDEAIETLLKLDPILGEKCSTDDNGYLGTIQSFAPGADEGEERPTSPKAEEWKEIIGPISAEMTGVDFGRGKRQKKVVKYDSDDESDSEEIYSPVGSSSDGSSDDSESEPFFEIR